MANEPMLILVAGPYRSGTGDDPGLIAANMRAMNEAALALHAKVGFRVVGTRERIGRHRGRWRDMLLLERRSPTVR